MRRDPSLQQAIEAAGNGKALAGRIGVTPQALSQWSRVPPRRVLDVEPSSVHQRTPLVVGGRVEMEAFDRITGASDTGSGE